MRYKRYEEAMADLLQVPEIEMDALTWATLATCQAHLNLIDEALASLKKSMCFPEPNFGTDDSMLITLERGHAFLTLGSYDEAISNLEKSRDSLRSTHPAFPDLRYLVIVLKARALRLKGDIDAAHEMLKGDLPRRIFNNLPYQVGDFYYMDFCIERGWVYMEKGLLNRATKEFSELLKIKKDPLVLCLRGRVYLKRKTKKKDAYQDFEDALEIMPNYAFALEGLELAKLKK